MTTMTTTMTLMMMTTMTIVIKLLVAHRQVGITWGSRSPLGICKPGKHIINRCTGDLQGVGNNAGIVQGDTREIEALARSDVSQKRAQGLLLISGMQQPASDAQPNMVKHDCRTISFQLLFGLVKQHSFKTVQTPSNMPNTSENHMKRSAPLTGYIQRHQAQHGRVHAECADVIRCPRACGDVWHDPRFLHRRPAGARHSPKV